MPSPKNIKQPRYKKRKNKKVKKIKCDQMGIKKDDQNKVYVEAHLQLKLQKERNNVCIISDDNTRFNVMVK